MTTKRDVAVAFLRLSASGRAREAFATYAAEGFRHHNPFFTDDATALMNGMDENARQNPDKHLEVLRTLEDADFVAVHSHVRHATGDRGVVVVHIFRFNGDRIAELWDLAQPVPERSVNMSGML